MADSMHATTAWLNYIHELFTAWTLLPYDVLIYYIHSAPCEVKLSLILKNNLSRNSVLYEH